MKIKEGKVIYLGDDPFWYDVTCGHLAPEDTLENEEDIERKQKILGEDGDARRLDLYTVKQLRTELEEGLYIKKEPSPEGAEKVKDKQVKSLDELLELVRKNRTVVDLEGDELKWEIFSLRTLKDYMDSGLYTVKEPPPSCLYCGRIMSLKRDLERDGAPCRYICDNFITCGVVVKGPYRKTPEEAADALKSKKE